MAYLGLWILQFYLELQDDKLACGTIVASHDHLWWFAHPGHLTELLRREILKLLHHSRGVEVHKEITLSTIYTIFSTTLAISLVYMMRDRSGIEDPPYVL